MDAWTTLNLSLIAGAVLGAAWLAAARALAARRTVPLPLLWAIGASGFVFGFAAILPTALAISRVDLPRTPAALLLAVAWGFVGGLPLFIWGNTPLRIAPAIVLVASSCLPTGTVAVGIGAIGGAMRTEKACYGNLRAVAKAFRGYVAQHHQWPPETRWVDELIGFLPYPKAFRCPADVGHAYHYVRPQPHDPDSTPIIVCRHTFVRRAVVVRKDLRVEEMPLAELEASGR